MSALLGILLHAIDEEQKKTSHMTFETQISKKRQEGNA